MLNPNIKINKLATLIVAFGLLISMGFMNPLEVKSQPIDCPVGYQELPNDPGWPHKITFSYNGNICEFEYEVCWRWADYGSGLERVYYIKSLSLVDPDCLTDGLFIDKYNEIIDSCVKHLSAKLIAMSWLPMVDCDAMPDGYTHNIIRVGHPSCISDPYIDCHLRIKPGEVPCECTKMVRSCQSFGSTDFCINRYRVCWIWVTHNVGNVHTLTMEKIFDGTSYIECPGQITFQYQDCPTMAGELPTKTLNCHPVCNEVPKIISIAPSSVKDICVVPNPTNNSTTLTFTVVEAGNLNIMLVNQEGQELMELHNADVKSGEFARTFSLEKFSQGIYFIKINCNGKTSMEKIIKN